MCWNFPPTRLSAMSLGGGKNKLKEIFKVLRFVKARLDGGDRLSTFSPSDDCPPVIRKP